MTRWMGDVSSRLVDERKMENLQLPVSQHFTNARLEQAYRQYIGTIQLGNDVAMTRLMMAYHAVATYKTLKEAHEMDWMTMLMICNFAVLGATLLLPSVWPGVWRRWRNVIMPPLLVSHTVALHIFLYTHSTSESLLGRGTLSRLIDQCAAWGGVKGFACVGWWAYSDEAAAPEAMYSGANHPALSALAAASCMEDSPARI
ncbi:hypothetical protein ACKKBG_A00580 [Auxenochlorella protothecoides x Auxenochlorella symbiontica]